MSLGVLVVSDYKNITPRVVKARKSKGTLEKRLGPEPKKLKADYERKKKAIENKWNPKYDSGAQKYPMSREDEIRMKNEMAKLDNWYKKSKKTTQKKYTRLISRRDDRLKRLKRIQGK